MVGLIVNDKAEQMSEKTVITSLRIPYWNFPEVTGKNYETSQ
jgi:hypothetical protein